MPFSRRRFPAVIRGGRPRPLSGVGRVLSPRGALAVHQVDGAFLFALRAALAMALVALPIVLAGRPDLAVYAMLGSFTTTFGRNLPYPRRARVLALVGVAMTACVGCGAALAALAQPRAGGAGAVAVVLATALVAGLAKFACDAARLGGLGAVLLLFSFAVAANSSTALADVLPRTGLAAAASAVAWGLALVGRLVHPDRPQRLAVAAALRALAELLDAVGAGKATGRKRHRATVAVLNAYHSLGLTPPADVRCTGQEGACARLTDMSWSLLIGSARPSPDDVPVTPERLRQQALLLADRRHRVIPLLPELASRPAAAARGRALPVTGQAAAEAGTDVQRASELMLGPRHRGPGHISARVVPALRMTLGTGVAGGLALLLGLGHGYWAAISAAAVLHSVNIRTTAQRAAQRTLGTVVGLLIALGVLAAHPDPTTLALVIVLLEFLLEYAVVRNYGLGVVFVTPLALLLSDMAVPVPVGELVHDRGLASFLGIAVGLICALLVVDDHAAVRVESALAACTRASEHAERALAGPCGPPPPDIQVRLAEAVVELREADDAAAGELWPAGIDPAELAAAEQRGYRLLERLLHHRWE
ncbi:FUSC family protein [Streptomyces spiralis]|uniref:FUSC family protein n=1 Tax=Streptomyces spiralis TaxID=66376 RepID=UPI00167BE51C|nr:FUSC family protein [Streptomyces spiralis]